MAFELIVGRSGSGKSAAIDAAIEQKHQQGIPCILVVPDPATFEAENRLMNRLGGGLLEVEVLGFTRLAYRVLEVAGGKTRLFLSTDGKKMALRRILEEKRDELQLYAGQGIHSGFIDHLSDLIRNFKYAQVSAEELIQLSEQINDELFKRKLHDVAILYQSLDRFMAGRYIDAEDAQNLLVERISEAEFFRETAIFIDGIPARLFSTQTYTMIEQLLRHALEVTMSICLNEEQDADRSIFAQQRRMYDRIKMIAEDVGIDCHEERLPKSEKITRSAPAAVKYLEQNLFAYDEVAYEGDGVRWYEAPNPREEVEAVANYIESLLRAGVRCGEIVIAMGNSDLYRPLLRRRLSHLPIFLDEGRALSSHGVVELSLASLDSVLRNFRAIDVLRVAKSGFSPITFEETEKLENYVIQYGIRFSKFTDPFTKIGTKKQEECSEEEWVVYQEELLELEDIRKRLIEPLQFLQESIKKATTAEQCAEALFEYYEHIELRARLDAQCESWAQRGEWDFANECAQVWNIMLELLDQIASLLDGEMLPARFLQVLEEGCLAHQIGMIPAQNDQITIGDVTRLSLRECFYVIVVGCNEGMIPAQQEQGALMDDLDLAQMEESGHPIFFDSLQNTINEQQTVYALFARAQKELYVSWSSSAMDGSALFASRVADRLVALFPQTHYADNNGSLMDGWPKAIAFAQTIEKLRETVQGSSDEQDDLETMLAYWQQDTAWSMYLKQIDAQMRGEGEGIRSKDIAPLYSFSGRTSVSRLETFNQCGFKHFVQYGLKPTARREFREEAIDQGNYYHSAFDTFMREMLRQEIDWKNLTQVRTDQTMDAIFDQIDEEHNNGVLLSTARNKAMARRMRETGRQTCWAMVQQIQAGQFTPLFSEVSLTDGDGLQPLQLTLEDGRVIELIGKIDRVDSFVDEDNQQYIRIIDYKTGQNEFTFQDLYYGLKLQLPLYCRAMESLGQPAGMFYLHISQGMNKESETSGSMTAEKLLLKKYQLKGILLKDTDIYHAMDENGDETIVSSRLKKDGTFQKSDFLVPMEQMDVLLDFAQAKAIESVERIQAGTTIPTPIDFGNNRTSCEYCDFSAVCRFESKREGRFRILQTIRAEEFWDHVNGDDEESEE